MEQESAYGVLAKAQQLERQGKDIVHFEIGQPDFKKKSFSFDLEEFDRKVGGKTKMIIINSPANPTGGVMPMEVLRHIADAAIRHDCWVLSDEIYSQLVYDGKKAPSIATLPGMAERTIIVDGFSKTYAMTGWRLGYGFMPEALAEKVTLLLNHAIGCTATFTQYAGIEAILGDPSRIEPLVAEYQLRRDRLVQGLNAIEGVTCRKPEGAFYVFPNVKSFGIPCEELADRLLNEAHVALLPGTAFGSFGEGYLRMSYATTMENIEEALNRIGRFFSKL
mgnify:CR=1 FL=1